MKSPAIILALSIAALAGCTKATPESCHAKWIQKHPNRAEYTACIVRYRVESGTATFEEREEYEVWRQERRARFARALGGAMSGGNVSEAPEQSRIECRPVGYGRTECTRTRL